MDILGDLSGKRRLPGYRCGISVLRQTNPELAVQAQRGIDSNLSAADVSGWLREHGADISGQVIANHRNGRCATCRRT